MLGNKEKNHSSRRRPSRSKAERSKKTSEAERVQE